MALQLRRLGLLAATATRLGQVCENHHGQGQEWTCRKALAFLVKHRKRAKNDVINDLGSMPASVLTSAQQAGGLGG